MPATTPACAAPWTVHGGDSTGETTRRSDPELSPINADLAGLPPTYLQVGTHDILLSDSDGFAERARAAGVDVGYSRFEGMWHDFQLAAGLLREADEAMADLGRALDDIWAGRPLADRPAATSSNGHRTPSVAIIGAGFGGIGLAITLKKAGIGLLRSSRRPTGSAGSGGTTPIRAPPATSPRTSTRSRSSRTRSWSRRYSPQPEILDYLERCVRKYGLRPTCAWEPRSPGRTSTRAPGAGGSRRTTGTWSRRMSSSRPRPAQPARRSRASRARSASRAPIFHTARWDHDVELEGKRVAVIGTGASTIQVVPAIAGRVGQLDVYQRSAPYVIPKKDRPYRGWEKRALPLVPAGAAAPALQPVALLRGLHLGLQPVQAGRAARGPDVRDAISSEQVSDPELKPSPDSRPRARLQAGADLAPTTTRRFERPNVELVTQGVRELTESGVIAEDGTERPADVIVLSTGFETTRFLAPMEIRGREGRDLNEVWRDGAKAYLGMTVAGFPNLFVMYGPNTNLGSGLDHLPAREPDGLHRRRGRAAAADAAAGSSVRPEVQRGLRRARCRRRLSTSVWQTGCNNWYVDENGRNTNNWPGFTLEYRRRTRRLIRPTTSDAATRPRTLSSARRACSRSP